MGFKVIALLGIFLFSVLLVSGCTGTSESPARLFENIELSFSEKPILNKEIEVTLNITGRKIQEEYWKRFLSGEGEYNETAVGDILLTEGFELISGNPNWNGYLGPGETKEITIIVKAIKEGKWSIKGRVGPASRGAYDYVSKYFLISQIDTIISDAPFPCFGEECTKMHIQRIE